jgi:hypothetical protein
VGVAVSQFDPATDPGAFAEQVLRQPLWDYQLEIARSTAHTRVVCAGRQIGKSVTLAVVSLFEAATRPNIRILIISAGDDAAKRLLAECSRLAMRSPLLASSVIDDQKNLITLSNGSEIRSVPASEKQIRGWSVDLLIIDEAGFISHELYEDSAEPTTIARPGSRILMVSSPWGGPDHFFRRAWQRGMDHPDEQFQSWHLPSAVSPLISQTRLDAIRETKTVESFEREYLATWTDDQGAFFSELELMNAVADYELTRPEDLEWFLDGRYSASAGVDWGYSNDANAVTLVSPLEDFGLNRGVLGPHYSFFLPWFEYKYKWAYTQFIDRIVEISGFYHLPVIASETNGVGAYPTTMLGDRMREKRRYSPVAPVVTDVRRKQSGFGMIKGLLQTGRLVLPRDPELLKQLRGLEFEQLPGGSMRIAVPERSGHDDVAMSFMQAVSGILPDRAVRPADEFGNPIPIPDDLETVTTALGVVVPKVPRPVSFMRSAFAYPRGSESGEGW